MSPTSPTPPPPPSRRAISPGPVTAKPSKTSEILHDVRIGLGAVTTVCESLLITLPPSSTTRNIIIAVLPVAAGAVAYLTKLGD